MGKVKGVYALGLVLGVMLFMLAMASIALAAGDANERQCGAETEASPGFRQYMPDCRAFELVTPPYKAGAIVFSESGAVSPDGSSVIMGAAGSFAGAGNYWFSPAGNPHAVAYEFARGATGWQSTALTPPASEYTYSTLMAVNATNFSETLWGAQHTGLRYHEDIYLRTGPGPSGFHRVGPGTPRGENGQSILGGNKIEPVEELGFAGASRDLTHALFEISDSEFLHNLWDGDTTKPRDPSLYEYVYSGSEDREPVLVGVRNSGLLDGGTHLNEGAELISDCGTELGASQFGSESTGSSGSTYNAVSASGEVVVFTAAQCGGNPPVNELYARINGEATVSLSEPLLPGGTAGECSASEPCHDAEPKAALFEGASENGQLIYFLSEQPLVDGASAEGMKLYEERLNPKTATVERVVDVSNEGAAGLNPEVQGVVRVSEEHERVYFVAGGKLTGADHVAGREPEETEPVQGADNLYVYEPDPAHSGAYRTVFVATLLDSSEEARLEVEETSEQEGIKEQAKRALEFEQSEIVRRLEQGEIEFARALELFKEAEERKTQFEAHAIGSRGPSGTVSEDRRVWALRDLRPAQATPDGGFLVFLSSARLTPQDSSVAPQLFEYSADGESLTRVSIGASGPSSGNVDAYRDAPQIPAPPFNTVDLPTAAQTGLAITADGSRIFFTSASSFVPQAKEDATNVYEYREGHVDLVSGGADASLTQQAPTVSLVGADPSGQNVFFFAASPLVPQQGDTQEALYDAREAGGFPAPALEPGCLGEECRGATGTTPQLQLPGSTSQPGGGNLPPSAEAKPPAKPKPKLLTRAQELAKALKACMSKRNKQKRASCEASARKAFVTKSARRAR
jgi:hypothetical protein